MNFGDKSVKPQVPQSIGLQWKGKYPIWQRFWFKLNLRLHAHSQFTNDAHSPSPGGWDWGHPHSIGWRILRMFLRPMCCIGPTWASVDDQRMRLCIPIGNGSFSNWPYLWERIWPAGDMNSETFVMNQFLWDYHSWAEGVQIEVLLLVSASLGFVQNESTYGDFPYQTEDCLEVHQSAPKFPFGCGLSLGKFSKS